MFVQNAEKTVTSITESLTATMAAMATTASSITTIPTTLNRRKRRANDNINFELEKRRCSQPNYSLDSTTQLFDKMENCSTKLFVLNTLLNNKSSGVTECESIEEYQKMAFIVSFILLKIN